tara:strand:- start:85 stop:330 length:246 start_codon:yes stop_codon:yes gene_type:complete
MIALGKETLCSKQFWIDMLLEMINPWVALSKVQLNNLLASKKFLSCTLQAEKDLKLWQQQLPLQLKHQKDQELLLNQLLRS